MSEQSIITVRNPATLAVVGRMPVCGDREAREAVERAREAQKTWGALAPRERSRALKRLRREVLRRQEEITRVIQSETAKTYPDAVTEVMYAAGALLYFADRLGELCTPREAERQLIFLNKRPLSACEPWPVVGMITPWNLPFTLSFGEAIPYLAMGSAVILKPSEWTPLSALYAEELCRLAGLPNGVFQVLPGYGETGARLIGSGADYISFTGSARTGKRVARHCAALLRPFSLELGGKTPFIILENTHGRMLDRAISCALWSAFANAGQYCKSTERLYVTGKHAAYVIEALASRAAALRAGQDYGPMITPFQLEIVRQHVADAVAKGARICAGGVAHPERGGQWFIPTVLDSVDHSMRIMREETFGPTLPVMIVRDDEEALQLANDCAYGLNAVVFSSDLDRAMTVARRLEAGAVTINDALINYMAPSVPYGGVKSSGWGRRHGVEGCPEFARQKTIFIHRFAFPFRDDLWWFPYTKRTELLMKNLARLNRFFAHW